MCNSEIYTLSCIVKYIVWVRQQCWCSKKYIFDQLTRPLCKDPGKSGPWWTVDSAENDPAKSEAAGDGAVACVDDIAEAKGGGGGRHPTYSRIYTRLRCQILDPGSGSIAWTPRRYHEIRVPANTNAEITTKPSKQINL